MERPGTAFTGPGLILLLRVCPVSNRLMSRPEPAPPDRFKGSLLSSSTRLIFHSISPRLTDALGLHDCCERWMQSNPVGVIIVWIKPTTMRRQPKPDRFVAKHDRIPGTNLFLSQFPGLVTEHKPEAIILAVFPKLFEVRLMPKPHWRVVSPGTISTRTVFCGAHILSSLPGR